jgi:methyltransferase (TIGR00027 family)
MEFGIGLRCHFMDELLRQIVDAGADTVLNLGAGLDTHPWRFQLPADLLWIEVDFPDMLDYKSAALGDAPPRCRVERMSADLNDARERAAVLERGRGGKTLLITEGLLMYLPATTVHALARETAVSGRFAWWMFDISSSVLMKQFHADGAGAIHRVRHEEHLEDAQLAVAIEQAGWVEKERRTYITDGSPFGRVRVEKMIQDGTFRPDPNFTPPVEDGSGVRLYHMPA